jgi:gliding motility-associated protein GldL
MSKSLTGKQIFKMWVDRFVSIGAAVVIIGALFKILHWKFANELLIVGMFTEAGIFLIYALLPQEIEEGKKKDEVGGTSKLDSEELVNALKDVKTSIDDTNKNIAFISSSANGLKELDSKKQ